MTKPRENATIPIAAMQKWAEKLQIGDVWKIERKADNLNNIEEAYFLARVVRKYTHHILLEEVDPKRYKRKADVLLFDMYVNRNSRKVVFT